MKLLKDMAKMGIPTFAVPLLQAMAAHRKSWKNQRSRLLIRGVNWFRGISTSMVLQHPSATVLPRLEAQHSSFRRLPFAMGLRWGMLVCATR